MQSRLVLIGGGLQKRRLQQLSQYLNIEKDVLLLDFVDNPYAWLAHASVFVLSSRWEGLPTVLVEALALEIPVVSTDCPSGPREILEGGKYGSLVPVGDISGMSEAIIEILQGRVRFSPVSESWRDQFSLTTAIDRYEKLLNLSYCLPNQNESNI
jgi:glycosyltransferase involved in cell wall biosynthesis